MAGVKAAIDVIIQFMQYPLFGGWLSITKLIMGAVVFELGIILWEYFSEKLGY